MIEQLQVQRSITNHVDILNLLFHVYPMNNQTSQETGLQQNYLNEMELDRTDQLTHRHRRQRADHRAALAHSGSWTHRPRSATTGNSQRRYEQTALSLVIITIITTIIIIIIIIIIIMANIHTNLGKSVPECQTGDNCNSYKTSKAPAESPSTTYRQHG